MVAAVYSWIYSSQMWHMYIILRISYLVRFILRNMGKLWISFHSIGICISLIGLQQIRLKVQLLWIKFQRRCSKFSMATIKISFNTRIACCEKGLERQTKRESERENVFMYYCWKLFKINNKTIYILVEKRPNTSLPIHLFITLQFQLQTVLHTFPWFPSWIRFLQCVSTI